MDMKLKSMESRLIEFKELLPELLNTNEVLDFLTGIDFFNKPGALKYHHNYIGGLFDHSLEVYNHLKRFEDSGVISFTRPESSFIIGMFHDLCKCDDYNIGIDGRLSWNNNRDEGHGDKSVEMILEKLVLTDEEIACIHEHMGVYSTSKVYWNEYNENVKQFPNILFTHVADMLSSQLLY